MFLKALAAHDGRHSMSGSRAHSELIYKQIGELVILWNDLELQVRRIMNCLCDDWFTVSVLSADMPAASLIQTVKIMAAESDADAAKMNRFIAAAYEKTGRYVRARDPIFEHVERVAECADKLRTYRNFFAHGVNSPTSKIPHFTLGGMTTRGKRRRLTIYEHPLRLPEIRKIIALISKTVRYGQRVEKCIQNNKDPRAMRRRSGPKWPKKIPIPKPVNRRFQNLTERIPLF
jgi:hypothetical protein